MSKEEKCGDPDHRSPYVEYENTQLWRSVNKAIGDLVQNKDVIEQTPRHYIVGYICKVVSKRAAQTPSLPTPQSNSSA